MQNGIKERRKQFGVSLDQLSAALGPGFSHARLSIAERGLIELSKPEQTAILSAIERIGELRSDVREIVQRVERINLAAWCSDIREQAHVAAV